MKKFYHIISVLFFALALQLSAVAQNTFTSLNGPFLGNVNDLVRTSTGVFIAAIENGLYRSTDGTTWTRFVLPIPAGGTAIQFQDLEINTASGLIYAVSFSTIFTSTDQGATWTFLPTTGLTNTFIRKIEVAPNGNVYVAQSNNTLYRANAATPTTFNLIFTFSSAINDLDIGPSNQVVVSTSSNSVQVSTNNGVNFPPLLTTGITGTANVASVAINSTGVLFAIVQGTGTGIFRSTDNGTNWTLINNNIVETFFDGFLETDATNNLFAVNNGGGKIYSVNAAGSLATPTWATVNYPATGQVQARAGVFQSLTNWQIGFSLYAVASTTDGGLNWTQTSAGLKAFNAFGSQVTPRIFQVSANNRLLMGWPGNGFFVSVDDGATWDLFNSTASNLNRNINGFIRASDNSIIGYGAGIVRSTDNAQNWTLQNAVNFHRVLTNVGSTLYSLSNNCCSVNTLQISIDNGVTWTNSPVFTGLPVSYTPTKLVSNSSTLFLLITGSTNNGIYTVNPTTGVCTKNSTIPIAPTDMALLGNTLVGISGTSMAVSADAGVNWVTRTLPSSATRVWVADELNFYAQTQTPGSFLVSNNSGATWNSFALGDATGQATDAIFSAQGFAYLVGSNMAAQKSTAVVMVPRAPTNLVELSKNSSFSNVSWDDNSSLESKYEVEASVGNNTSYQLVQATGIINTFQNKTSTTVTADAVTPTFVRVRAVNAGGASAYSNEISITAMNNSCTPPLGDFIPDNRSWTATAVADAGFTATNVGPFTSSTASIFAGRSGNLTGASTDDIRFGMEILGQGIQPIFANFNERCGQTAISSSPYQNNGNGTWNPATKTLTIKWQTNFGSQPFKGTTTFVLNASDPIPLQPSLTAYIYSGTEVLLNWSLADFATGYDLERSTTSGSGFVDVPQSLPHPSSSFVDKNLTSGQTYFYRVRAKNTTGASIFSTEASIATGATLFRPIENTISQNFESQQGVAWGDLDGDGDDDIAMSSFTTSTGLPIPPVFYENKGNGVFDRRDLANLANETSSTGRGMGLFDFDNDNDLDIIIARSGSGSAANALLMINNGGWNFSKISLDSSTPPETGNTWRGFGITDYDRDGFADLFLGNAGSTPMNSSVQLRNTNGVAFTRTTIGNFATDLQSAITILPADYDNDGDQDVFVVNRNFPAVANKLFKNNGDGTFTQVTGLVFDTDLSTGWRTGSWGDIDNDGDLDLYVGDQNSGGTDKLYQNNGNGTFTSLIGSPVAETGTTTFGSAFGDIDNDGDLDLIAVNFGANSIFINNGSGVFTKSASQELLTHPAIPEISGAFSDIDGDGFLDFFAPKGQTSSVDLPNLLYENTLAPSSSRNWIQIKLKGTSSNFAAIGARVTVSTTAPNRTQIREVMASTGNGSQNSLVQHFGIGTATTVATLTVKWPNGGINTFTNVAANQILTLTEDVVGPTFGTLSPATAATGIATATKLAFTLNEAGTGVVGKNINVYLTSNTTTAVFTLAATTGTVVGNTFTYTLPQKLNLNTSYSVSIDAGAFRDASNNVSLVVPVTGWQFTTSPGPQVTTLTPANNATGIAANAALSIVFNGNITSVANKKILVVDAASPTIPLLNANVSTGTITNATFTIPAPASTWPGLKTLVVTVEAGAFQDAALNDFVGISSGWSFTTADLISPTITATIAGVPAILPKGGVTGTKFTVTVTDNVSVASVIMSYRKVTATQFQTLTSVAGTLANTYDFPLQATFFDDMGMEYFFTAKDPSNNTTLFPTTGNAITKLSFSATTTAVGVAAGSQVGDYKIISIPLDLATTNIANIFADFGPPDGTQWKLLKYRATPQAWLEYPNAFSSAARGEGYFILSREGKNLKFEGATAPSFTQANLFQLNLVAGFNLIGNPYTMAINWEDSRAGLTGVNAVKVFQGGNYVDGNAIEPYSGGFVFATAAVVVPVKLKTSASGGRISQPAITTNIDEAEWILPIKLVQNERQFNFGGVGMSPKASYSYDGMDDLAPPSPYGNFEMKFAHPEHFMKKFSRDVVPTGEGHTWAFVVETDQAGEVNLQWDNTVFSASNNDIYLFDVVTQRPVNMKNVSSYSFSSSTTDFKIYFGKNAVQDLKPSRVFLGQAYPNPSTGSIVSIPFNLPESTSQLNVQLEVFDGLGKKVETLLSKSLPSGFYTETWDTNLSGQLNGMYFIRLSVNGQGKTETVSTKLIILK